MDGFNLVDHRTMELHNYHTMEEGIELFYNNDAKSAATISAIVDKLRLLSVYALTSPSDWHSHDAVFHSREGD
jgi:hypothetical protein